MLAPAAAGHPGHGGTEVIIDGYAYKPASVTIAVNDPVFWGWNGFDRNHSVTSDPGQAEQFDSDPSRPPTQLDHPMNDVFYHYFNRVGRFSYHCKVHPSMRGEVVVVARPPGVDSQAPRITGVRVKRGRLRFTLSEKADLIARISRLRRGRRPRTLKAFDLKGKAGRNSKRLPLRGFGRGRYRLALTAYDAVDNRSPTVTARFRVP